MEAERLVPISDFSQGKAGKIFNDVAENDNEYNGNFTKGR